jgi:hypothetical protein
MAINGTCSDCGDDIHVCDCGSSTREVTCPDCGTTYSYDSFFPEASWCPCGEYSPCVVDSDPDRYGFDHDGGPAGYCFTCGGNDMEGHRDTCPWTTKPRR